MILLLDTSTPTCKLTLITAESRHEQVWEADRDLAKGLLGFLDKELNVASASWSDLSGLGVFQGPGSFTGLRIGMAVLNTMADTLAIPIVTVRDDDWQGIAEARLEAGENDHLALPYYGASANITKPRK